jgi:hypothetical protein
VILMSTNGSLQHGSSPVLPCILRRTGLHPGHQELTKTDS